MTVANLVVLIDYSSFCQICECAAMYLVSAVINVYATDNSDADDADDADDDDDDGDYHLVFNTNIFLT